jgi:adenylylsulfate kinase
MTKRILIMGLPGSGKTTLASDLFGRLMYTTPVAWFNADEVRQIYNDWDFSAEGRVRQAYRMRSLADSEIAKGKTVICDFVSPTQEIRDIFNANFTVWVDTIDRGRYEDTNKLFEIPDQYDVRVTEQDSAYWSDIIADRLYENHKSSIHR